MTAKEHAEIWERAASIVSAMDPRRSPVMITRTSGTIAGPNGGIYTETQAAMWDAYSAAASVIFKIADEYNKAAST